MDELTAFVSARLDEDEAAARAAPGSNWQAFTEDDIAGASVYDEQWVLLYPRHYDHDNKLSAEPGATGPMYIERSRDALCAHIARHDPARVLREVAAKRRILDDYRITVGACQRVTGSEIDTPGYRAMCAGRDALKSCVTLLAAVWSDHPGYRAEWKA